MASQGPQHHQRGKFIFISASLLMGYTTILVAVDQFLRAVVKSPFMCFLLVGETMFQQVFCLQQDILLDRVTNLLHPGARQVSPNIRERSQT